VRGLPPARTRLAAAVASLHGHAARADINRIMSPLTPADRRLAMRLGAILRVADGLDHSHLQDTAIASVRATRQQVEVRVDCRIHPECIAWARDKADLWNRTFDTPLDLRAAKPARAQPRGFAEVVAPDDTVSSAVRRLGSHLYLLVRNNVPGAVADADTQHLHDIRVALRRVRAVLRMFRPELRRTTAQRVDDRLASACAELGAARDLDVWADYLAGVAARAPRRARKAWQDFARAQRQAREPSRQQRQGTLAGVGFEEVMAGLKLLLRRELPAAGDKRLNRPAAKVMARRLRKLYRRILKHGRPPDSATPEELHAFRKLVRRARYWAEFAAPVIDLPVVHALAGRLKKLADALGRLHDMDVFQAHLAPQRDACPAGLRARIAADRNRAWQVQNRAWHALAAKPFRRDVANALSAAARGPS
jgi:CHAD domain-containing protein